MTSLSFWLPIGGASLISALLYLRVLFVVYESRKNLAYSSFFFKMTISQGVIDLGYAVCYLAAVAVTEDGLLGTDIVLAMNDTAMALLVYIYALYFLFAQITGVMIITFNRFLAVCWHHSAAFKVMDSAPRWILVSVHLLFPVLLVLHMIWFPWMKFGVNSSGAIMRIRDASLTNVTSLETTLFASLAAVFCAGCYLLVLRKLVASSNSTLFTATTSGARHRRGSSTSLSGIALFFTLCITAAYYLALFLATVTNNPSAGNSVRLFNAPVKLLFCFVQPWVMLITNRPLRKKMAKFFTLSVSTTNSSTR